MPLPCISTPFERIALDIIGPLPRNRSGNRYVLVICDYGTRYPEAKLIDAEHVLVKPPERDPHRSGDQLHLTDVGRTAWSKS